MADHTGLPCHPKLLTMYLLTRCLALFMLVLGLSLAFAWAWDQGDQRVASAPAGNLGAAQTPP